MKKLSVLFLLFTYSCTSQSQNHKDIDKFIVDFDTVDFSYFKDVFVAVRSRGLTDITYIISKKDGNLPVYFVTYNPTTRMVTEINNSNLVSENVKDYFTKSQIEDILAKFRKYNFLLLGVDSDGNVFINPYTANEPAIFLRTTGGDTTENTLKKGYVFRHYKANWYLNKTGN